MRDSLWCRTGRISFVQQRRGYLHIFINDALTSLDGLSGLTTVGGYLDIRSNDALTSLDGLSGITSVGGDLYIQTNYSLCQSSVDAFVAGISVSGSVTTYSNDDSC